MVAKVWKHAIETEDLQRAFIGPPVGTRSVGQLPGGPSLKIDPQTREDVSVFSGFYSSIGVMIILSPRNERC
jgi:hypothetical protein